MLPWLPYPSVMVGVFALFAWFQAQGASLVLSTYVPVVLAAGAVTLCERLWPHRLDWRPPDGEVRTDLAFMAVVQMALLFGGTWMVNTAVFAAILVMSLAGNFFAGWMNANGETSESVGTSTEIK